MILAGCQDATSPKGSGLLIEKQRQTGATQLSDDTSDSEIVSPQYPKGTTVIVAVGDSITYGWGTWTGGYPTKLQAKLLADGYNVVVINAGIPGESSPSTDERFLPTIAGTHMVLLMIGTNDIMSPRGCLSPFNCNTIGHIESMLDKALISKVTLIVSTVIPENPYSFYLPWNIQIEALNAEIKQAAAVRKVNVVDNYTAILQNGGSDLYIDKNHFTDQGNEVFAQQWYNAIVQSNLIKPPR